MKYATIADLPKLHPGEPFFFIRGQDAHAPAAILHYTRLTKPRDATQANELMDLLENVTAWQKENPEKVKFPD